MTEHCSGETNKQKGPVLCSQLSYFIPSLAPCFPASSISSNMSSYSDEIDHNIKQLKQCTTIPPFINSPGVFQGDRNLLEATLPRLELLMFAIFFTSHVFHFILKRFSIPLLVSQILAGMILGKAGLGLQADYRRIMFGIDSDQLFGTIGGFGFQLFAFLNGVKMDLSLMRKTGRMALCSGVLSMVMPLLFGAVTTSIVNSYLGLLELDKLSLSLVMLVHSMTPFPVTCSFVSDLELTHSELGRLGLSAALSSELLTQFLACNAFLVGIFYQYHYFGALKTVAIATAFITLTVFVVRPAMLWVIKQTPEGRPVRDLYISFVVLGALVSGLIFQFIGLNMFLGSLAFGLAVPAGPPLASALVDKFECMVSGVLIPLFMAMCASLTSSMKANFREISFDKKLTKGAAIVVTVVSLTKFGACLVTLFYYRMPKQDAFALAFIISSKGIVELGAYAFISESGLFTEGMFSFLAITILVSATVSPIFVNWLYDPWRKYAGYQKRNIMHSKDLCVLACIYRPDNVTSIINFLQALCPTLESPVSVCALHLIKISGRATSLFISHQKQKRSLSARSISENVILSFSNFWRNNCEIESVNVFTSISPTKFMHQDICTLALDELASFIVLPFHLKWLVDGSIESQDSIFRTLNCCVLERAPCSVGILIDHGNQVNSISRESSREQSLLVALIFFGGEDDREALVLAKHMSQHRNISLTIIHFVLSTGEIKSDWEKMQDSDRLRNMKPDFKEHREVTYIEETVSDGLETSNKIRSILHKYDFFIVGRRKDVETIQTAGLDYMNEYPELGAIGNLLASMETTERYSVLVVQQQISL